jgi:hypothetical protein
MYKKLANINIPIHTIDMVDKIFHLQEWTPQVTTVAQNVIDRIHIAAPELEVLFMGAAALKLPGKNDIDLDILCSAKDIAHYTELLSPILGKPKETSVSITAWKFMQDDFEIDCILSDPTISHVPRQRKVFEVLKASDSLLKEYEELKRDCKGLPYEEYEKRKKAFFARVAG